jgi:hypothetical protein
MITRVLDPALWNWCKPEKDVGKKQTVSLKVNGESLPRVRPSTNGEDSVKLASICSEPSRLQMVTSGALFLSSALYRFPRACIPDVSFIFINVVSRLILALVDQNCVIKIQHNLICVFSIFPYAREKLHKIDLY